MDKPEQEVETRQTPTESSIPEKHYFRIGEVAEIVGVKPYVLRYWESEFPVLSPAKSQTGQRLFRRTDVETLLMIKHLLYAEKYSIQGAKNKIGDLRKSGELKTFRDDKVHGGTEVLEAREEAHRFSQRVEDLLKVARRPMSELFKL